MFVKRFHITDYKCIRDSGWVATERVTALVGKNESGKTAVLEALQKFYGDGDVQFAPKDFPRDRSKEHSPDKVCVEIQFLLNDTDKTALGQIIPELANVDLVRITKTYGNHYFVDLGLPSDYTPPNLDELENSLKSDLDPNAPLDAQILEALEKLLGSVSNEGTDLSLAWATFENSLTPIAAMPAAAQIVTEIKTRGKKEVEQIKHLLNAPNRAQDKVLELLPKFVYFEDYDIIEGKVNVQQFAAAKTAGVLKGEFKTVNNLLAMARLDVNHLIELEKAGDTESRAILCHQASTEITGLTTKYWKQRSYNVQFRVDGPMLTTYVLDEVNGSPIALEDRSKGFKTQFSFNVNFHAATQSELKGAVLLLDEPGLHLHASAQANLLRLIDDLSVHNQIVYSTHSPFMIDPRNLGRVRICRETYEDDAPQVTDQYWTGDADSVFPLLSALGYDLSQSLFVGRNNLILEGITDYWYLTTISERLKELNRKGLKDKITVTPVGGAGKVYYMAVFMAGQKLDVVALLDSETEGRKVKQELIKNKILKERKVLLVSESFDVGKEMDMEDLIPEDFYLRLVEESYKQELGGQQISLSTPHAPRIVVALTEFFESRSVQFHKTRPARLFLTRFSTLRTEDIPTELLDNFEKLIKTINALFP